ncbi:MAG TPA: glycosyl hydrolase family 28-related protein [Azospirillaceae bacterium]|nr:glycosyl hydrolase family 28-related protein [Azospirillaceae bacterium]
MATVSILKFGAKGDGVTDNTVAIQKTIDYAKANGLDVHVPTGTFVHKNMINLHSGVDIYGSGTASVLKAVGASTNDNQAIKLSGSGGGIHNIALDSDATTRASTGDSAKIWVMGASNFTIEGVTIKNSMSAGILVTYGSSYGKIINNKINSTNADSIHMSSGSHHITVSGNYITNPHDDGIAVVSYERNGTQVHDITITNNTVMNNVWGRNISVVGGYNVNISKNTVDGNKAGFAGVYISGESSYDTYGVRNVTVADNIIKNVGGATTGHGAVMIYNSTGYMVEDIFIKHNQIMYAAKNSVMIRGSKIDDITISYNLFEKSAAAPVAISGTATDVRQISNTTSRTTWSTYAAPEGSEDAGLPVVDPAAEAPEDSAPADAPAALDPSREEISLDQAALGEEVSWVPSADAAPYVAAWTSAAPVTEVQAVRASAPEPAEAEYFPAAPAEAAAEAPAAEPDYTVVLDGIPPIEIAGIPLLLA